MSDGKTDEPRAANVIEALARVMRDLPAIGKDGKADPKQGGYAYRGIEQITSHTQALFARHGVVFVPRVVSYEVQDLMVNNKPWTDTQELVEYTVYGPGGIEDRITVGPILAIGRDNSDKGGNKALTQAYKYALLQTLCISDGKDDADGATHEADNARVPARVSLPGGREWVTPAKQRVVAAAGGDKDLAGQAWAAIDPEIVVIDAEHKHVAAVDVDRAVDEAETLLAAATPDGNSNGAGDAPAETDAPAAVPAGGEEYAPDDPGRPFTEGENERPWADPDSGKEF